MRKRVLGHGLFGFVSVTSLALVVTSGCKSDSDSETNAAAPQEQAASISTGPVVDNKIAKAVANAAQAQAAAGATVAKGPPETGILGKTRADEELRTGEPPKLKLGSTGSEPRVQLGLAGGNARVAFDNKAGQIDTGIRTGASVFPSAAFKLEFGRAVAPGSAQTTEPSDPVTVAVSFVQSELSANQQAQIPAELGVEVRKLKGSQLTFQFNGTGVAGGPATSLAKEANPQVGKLVQAAASGLSEALVSLPEQPVGAGAFWMVTSRDDLLGTDVVAYRMVKLTEIKDGRVRLEVNTKRYLAADDLGRDFDHAKALQFHADGSAELVLVAGQPLPIEGRSQTAIRTFAEIEGTPRPIQIEFRNEFAFK